MCKIAIATDSNSGITIEEARKNGIFVLTMPCIVDGKIYLENINIDQKKFFEMIDSGCSVSTSQPGIGELRDFWDEILKSFDCLVYFPMTSGLSGSCDTAKLVADQYYQKKVYVIDNKRISVGQRRAVYIAKQLADEGKSVEEIVDYSMKTAKYSQALITVDTLKYLKKGGRLTPMAAAISTVLRIKPTLLIEDKKIDAYAKPRTMNQAKELMINETINLIEKKFSGDGLKPEDFYFDVAYSGVDEGPALKYLQEIKEKVKGQEDIVIAPLSLSVACHIGPGALAIGIGNKYI